MRVSALVVPFLLLAPSVAAAQTAAPPFELSLRASAALELAARRARAPGTALKVADDVFAPRRRSKQSEGATLMILGGAAVVVGAIAGGGGGTVLIVGGLVCAGYGVYLYTQ
jgi:predicted phage tail protein